MAYVYDKLYGETPHALGQPTQIFVDFFERFEKTNLRVLDVGCGQGRDALFIARLGHNVVGVDASANGIRDMRACAKREGLSIEGSVQDIRSFIPSGLFDVILIDRTLHMLTRDERCSTLTRLLEHVETAGWILIADEASNIADFKAVFAGNGPSWSIELQKKGYLFARRS
ncbi:MAG: class I SAM-dependent methyltransferase [Sulfitobacter sp.]